MGKAAVPECRAAANSLSGPRAARRFVAAVGVIHPCHESAELVAESLLGGLIRDPTEVSL